jgi:hypothetical protein
LSAVTVNKCDDRDHVGINNSYSSSRNGKCCKGRNKSVGVGGRRRSRSSHRGGIGRGSIVCFFLGRSPVGFGDVSFVFELSSRGR